MPLPFARPRELLTRRTVTCEGYLRDDGLVDVEGHCGRRPAPGHEVIPRRRFE